MFPRKKKRIILSEGERIYNKLDSVVKSTRKSFFCVYHIFIYVEVFLFIYLFMWKNGLYQW